MTVKGRSVPFEKALDMTGYSWYNVGVFLLSSSIITGMTMEIFSVSYLVPASACELNTSSAQQGLVACVPLIGIIATSQIWGYFADTRGRRKILIISMSLAYITGTAAAFSPNWIVFSFFKLLSSASVAGAFALSVTLLSECTPSAKRSSLVLLATTVYLAGLGVMAVAAIPILPLTFSYYIPLLDIHFNSWRVLDLIFAVPCAIGAIGSYFAFESPKYLVSVGQQAEAIKVLTGMYVMNTGNSADSFEVVELELDEEHSSALHKGFWGSILSQTIPMMKPPLLKHTLLLSSLYGISYITMNAFFVWLPLILNAFMLSIMEGQGHLTICDMIRQSGNSSTVDEVPHCSLNSVAMVLVFGFNMILAFINILMSRFVDYIGRKTLFVGLQVLGGTAGLFINLSPYWILSAFLFVVFLSAILNFGFLNTFSVDVFPTYVRAMAVCLTLMVGRGSAIIGINVLKRLLDTNCEAAFYIFGSITVGGGIVGLLLPSEDKLKAQTESSKT